MERRLLLAVVLSFMVLYIWAALIPKPKPSPLSSPPEITQPIEIKEDTEYQSPSAPSPFSEQVQPAVLVAEPQKDVSDIITILENENYIAEFSNMGGVLHKLVLRDNGKDFPIEDYVSIKGLENADFELISLDNNQVSYQFENDEYIISKIYSLSDDYTIHSEVIFTNKTDMSKQNNIDIGVFTLNMSSLESKSGGMFAGADGSARDVMLYEYSVSSGGKVVRKRNASKFSPKDKKEGLANIDWLGFRDRYYCAIVKTIDPVDGYNIAPKGEKALDLGVNFSRRQIPAQGNLAVRQLIYVGPQDIDALKKFGLKFEEIVNYNIGGFFDVFALGLGDLAAKLLLAFMQILYKVIPSWGLCIIIVAAFVCGATYPLTITSMRSMKRMQAVQPEMAQLKDKFKDNPQRYNKEVMELYKRHNVNPLGGCLPMFLQMPIFFGVIQLMWRYVGFKGSGFLWIDDLSQPDRLFIFPFNIPILGNELNILPILVFVLSLFQMQFSSKNMVTTDPNMAMQQKMMKYLFPAMIILFFYKFPSALGLYFAVFYMYQTFFQWKMSKEPKVA